MRLGARAPALLTLAFAAAACGRARTSELAARVHASACTTCHGGLDNDTGAPPFDFRGNTSTTSITVGAHTAHVTPSPLGPGLDCTACHPDARDGSRTHGDGKVDLSFGPIATAGGLVAPVLDRADGGCSNVYCHGATLGGGSHTTPQWTRVGEGEAACGSCHGLPPPDPHPAVPEGRAGCYLCHPDVDSAGELVRASGLHVNGRVEMGHPTAWMDESSGLFHATRAVRGLTTCRTCHGAKLEGGSSSVACAICHGTGFLANCTGCHGGADSSTGAPPRTTWGRASDPIRVGAHTVHLAGSAIAGPVACGACHVVPVDALSPGHIDGDTATVTFSGPAIGDATPSWDRATATCAGVYCHGSYSGTFSFFFYETRDSYRYAGARGRPQWTGGAMTCTSCHGNPPAGPVWHGNHAGGNNCDLCHPDAAGLPGGAVITDPTLHVNGVVDLSPKFELSCFGCH
jgi:predicted CxxxxCH...CXXCH cytochrome family protein